MRRTAWALAAFAIAMAAAALAFGPYVRARVAEEAARRRLVVEIDHVRPAWLAVRLVGVHARLEGVDGIDAHLDEVRIDLRPRVITVRGGRVEIDGAPEALRDRLRAWRATSPSASGGSGAATQVRVADLGVAWRAGDRGTLAASGVGVERDAARGLALRATAVHAETAHALFDARDADVSLDRDLALRRAHAASATVRLAAREPPSGDEPKPARDLALAAVPRTTLVALRERAADVAAKIAARLPPGAEVAVDGLSLRVPHGDRDLSSGPGPLTIAHAADAIVVRLATRADGAAPLTIDARLPTGDGDVSVSFAGGPVSLAALGLEDGALGLTDLDRGTIGGDATLVLRGDASALDARGAVDARAISIAHRRLAADVVRGLDLHASGSVELRAEGTIAFDGEVGVGRARVALAGSAAAKSDRWTADVRWNVERASCQDLLGGLPQGLAPHVFGSAWSGTFATHGRVAVDSRRIDDLVLDWDVEDLCKVESVPEPLTREHFAKPFTLVVYDPHGAPREETFGPGTPRWTPLASMSRFMPVAVVMTEDGGVYRNGSWNRPQVKLAVVTDLKERRFARGASTLLMQLAKNLFLARDKTLARKLEQVVLTEILSQTFAKKDVLELYLNVVEFGPNVYGARDAALHYFGKGPWGLSFAESLFLASLLPSPVKLHGLKSPNGLPAVYTESIRHLMDLAAQSGLVTQADLEEGKREEVRFAW